jgi:dsDNA-specific endonuclease/ATPase MutS2
MRQNILQNNMIMRAEEVCAQIKHAEDLIQKYLDHDFCSELHEAHEKKWGKCVDLSEPIDVNGVTMYTWDMSREKATTPELKQQEKDEQHAIYQKAHEEEQKTLDDIFAHIRKHLQEWWD